MPVPATGFDVDLSLYDDFSRNPNGSIEGETPIAGGNWATAGESVPTIQNGYLVNNGGPNQTVGYLYSIHNHLAPPVRAQGARTERPPLGGLSV